MYPKHEIEEILFAEFISVTGGVIAGIGLSMFLDKILLHPGAFILIPGLLEMRGNIAGTMASRISSALHIHKLNPEMTHSKIIRDNTIASFTLSIIVGLVLGIVALIATNLVFGITHWQLIPIALISAILSTLLMLPLTTAAVFWLFKHGFDPDDIMGPYVTTIGDIIMIVALYVAVSIV